VGTLWIITVIFIMFSATISCFSYTAVYKNKPHQLCKHTGTLLDDRKSNGECSKMLRRKSRHKYPIVTYLHITSSWSQFLHQLLRGWICRLFLPVNQLLNLIDVCHFSFLSNDRLLQFLCPKVHSPNSILLFSMDVRGCHAFGLRGCK